MTTIYQINMQLKHVSAIRKPGRFFVAIIFAAVTVFSSCTGDEPLVPDTDPRDKFLGSWQVAEETEGQSTGTYPATVTEDNSNTSRIRINNIFNLGNSVSVTALVAGSSVDIGSQTVSGVIISGNGLFTGSSFILNYTTNSGGGPENIKATYIR